jgi:hypothetical protein
MFKWKRIEQCPHKKMIIGVIIKNGILSEIFQCWWVKGCFRKVDPRSPSNLKTTHYIDMPEHDD